MSLTKAELANSLSEKLELSKAEAKILTENFFEELCLALENGEEIKLSGFGNFELKRKTARPGRNPKTGEEVIITPRTVVTFKQGQKLKSIMAAVSIKPEAIEPEHSPAQSKTKG